MTAGIIKLTEQQFYAFMADRLDGKGPSRVQEDLPFPALANTTALPNARRFIEALGDGGATLTARGNLNRTFMETLLDRLQWPGYEAGAIRSVCKIVNQQDFPPAQYLDALFRLAGLARHKKGILELTRKGRMLLTEDEAGRLQALLFRTTFARYNLA